MNVRSARVFVAAAEELSFSRAAERLLISAPHVSETIKKLEREVGQTLFDRTPRSVQLTDAAEALLPAARALLSAHGELEAQIDDLRSDTTLVFGRFYGFANAFLSALTERLRHDDDSLACRLHLYDWTDPTCGLRSGETDAAVLVGPTEIDDGLSRIPIGEQRRVAVVPGGADVHPDGDGTISLAEVDRIGLVPVVVHDRVWNAAWRLHDVRGGPPPLVGTVQDRIDGMIDAIQSGLGATVTIEVFGALYTPAGAAMYPLRDVPALPVDLAFRGPSTAARFAPVIAAARDLAWPASF